MILEAWGPDLPACCEEAVAALASVYVEGTGAETATEEVDRLALHLAPGADDEVLLELLEEVIFTLDTSVGVPVRAEIAVGDDRGLDVELVLADPATVEPTGAVPKAVSRSELAVTSQRNGLRCRFLVDV